MSTLENTHCPEKEYSEHIKTLALLGSAKWVGGVSIAQVKLFKSDRHELFETFTNLADGWNIILCLREDDNVEDIVSIHLTCEQCYDIAAHFITCLNEGLQLSLSNRAMRLLAVSYGKIIAKCDIPIEHIRKSIVFASQ